MNDYRRRNRQAKRSLDLIESSSVCNISYDQLDDSSKSRRRRARPAIVYAALVCTSLLASGITCYYFGLFSSQSAAPYAPAIQPEVAAPLQATADPGAADPLQATAAPEAAIPELLDEAVIVEFVDMTQDTARSGQVMDMQQLSGDMPEGYAKTQLSDVDDLAVQQELDMLERTLESVDMNRPEAAMQLLELLNKFEAHHSTSPRGLLGSAVVLDQLAELERSNARLEAAIHAYEVVLALGPQVPDALFLKAGEKCSKRLEFRGWMTKAIVVQRVLAQRFPANVEVQNRLGQLLLLSGSQDVAKEVFASVSDRSDFAKVHLGFILKIEGSAAVTSGNSSGGGELLSQGVELMKQGLDGGTDWSVTKDGRFYLHLGDGLRRLSRTQEADEVFQKAAQLRLIPSFWQRSLYNVDGLTAKPFWDLSETGLQDQLQTLIMHWPQIREEALSILQTTDGSGFQMESEDLRDTGSWTQFELFRQGKKMIQNCAKAPRTCQLIEAIPDMAENRRGQVKFSAMQSGTHVRPHAGPTNCRLRAHLGLKVPTSAAVSRLRVTDQERGWAEGSLLVFDDSFDHEVWYEDSVGGQPRVILIADFWHPDLRPEVKQFLSPI